MNKKSLIFAFILPFVLIVIVGLLGSALVPMVTIVHVSKVAFVEEDSNTFQYYPNSKIIEYTFDISKVQTYQLKWNVLPENADEKKVTFESDHEEIATVSSLGLVKLIEKNKSVQIKIRSVDNPNKYDVVYINIMTTEPNDFC